jgi:hypothetical protein
MFMDYQPSPVHSLRNYRPTPIGREFFVFGRDSLNMKSGGKPAIIARTA